MQDKRAALWTIFYGILGAIVFMLFSMIPTPFTMVSIIRFGFIPALAIIGLVGAIRGPIAGLLTGYFGTILADLILQGVIVTMTLPALAYGVMGLIVGLASYDLANGRSLVKLSILSTVGFVFAALLVVVIGLFVEGYAVLVGIAFFLLPKLTSGIPTVLLLTPVFARIWHAANSSPDADEKSE
jgi:uncharacterized membrane protein